MVQLIHLLLINNAPFDIGPAKINTMAFRDDLMAAGFRSRYQTIQLPFEYRIESGDGGTDSSGNTEGDSKGDGLTLRGLAVPFNSPTRISNFFEGTFDEQFAPGSFKRTIGIGGQVMLFEHGDHPMFGSLPIAGIRRVEETKRGLEVTARMYDNWLTEPLRDAISDKAVNGMSIQFRSIVEEIEDRGEDDVPMVTIMEADLRELGPVLFPAYTDTELDLRKKIVDSVRRGFDLVLQSCVADPDGGKETGSFTSSGETHLATRKRLAVARVRTLEMN